MKNLQISLLLLAFVLISRGLYGQLCKTTLSSNPSFDFEEFVDYQQKRIQSKSNNSRFIGLTIHIVESVQGASNIEIEKLYEELDNINRYFAPSDLQFFFCGSPRTVPGREIYTYGQASAELNRQNHIPNTLNIFYLDEIGNQELSQLACGISTFPWTGRQEDRFIIMQKGCSISGATLAHEIGHFFGLLHTHETFLGLELVNGSNCDSAGDLLCDTRPDYNLAQGGLDGCSYVGDFTDPNGDRYEPDPSNLMSYAPSQCQRRFSQMQNDLMNFYYDTEYTNLLTDCDFYPDFSVISSSNSVEAISGQNIKLPITLQNESEILSEIELGIEIWLSTTDEDLGLRVHNEKITFNSDQSLINTDLTFALPFSFGSGEYFMTVLIDPDAEILERDERNNFFELDLVIDNSQLIDLVLFPNPVMDNLNIFIRDKTASGKVNILITDALGRIKLEDTNFKANDELFTSLTVSSLPAGYYIINIQFRFGGERSIAFYKSDQ